MASAVAPVARITRDAFTARLDDAAASNPGGRTLGLLVIRVHHLRRVNATFGHAVSDRILTDFGDRLRTIARGHDEIHLIADDEYAMILPNLTNRGHAELAANKAIRAAAEPFTVGKTAHTMAITIGIGTSTNAAEAAQLLQRAELALASAESAHTPYAAYADATARATALDWDIETELTDALAHSELEMYYQPQLEIASNRICGAEALMRWHHPERGLITPDFFIGAAERTNQIRPITWSALNMALQRAGEWPTLKLPLKIGVNISAGLLSDREFAALVLNAIGIWGVAPQRLVLEITETALMRELEKSYATLKRLHDAGITISIDDFGTGYSSFAYFRNLPAREIKVDKDFVIKMLKNDKDHHIVESLIGLARKFELRTVAEGVTDEATLDALRDLDCDVAQGYYLAEPMPHDEFMEFLDRNRRGWQPG
ncbi:MAG TPA: GGDEF domain-containing phosphodiesterase [Gammaproteobacteria bacterium]|nr:GGDEF domain-containing phosphodiesterase [Gammaproteobacteria bacterium]